MVPDKIYESTPGGQVSDADEVDSVEEVLGPNDDPWIQAAKQLRWTYYAQLEKAKALIKPDSRKRALNDLARYKTQVELFVDARIADGGDSATREAQIEEILNSVIRTRAELRYQRSTR